MSLAFDSATEDRIQRQLDRGANAEPAEVINLALDLLEGEEDWLICNRKAIDADLDESSAQAARGEGFSPEDAKALLASRTTARAAAPLETLAV